MSYRIFSIEGNIGSGKSTLVNVLKENFSDNKNIIFVQEPVDIWNTITDVKGETILAKFYKDQDKYSFSFQMMAYISRISLLRKIIKQNPTAIIITERSVFTDKNVFAKMLYDDKKIEEVNYQIYLKWFDEFIDELPLTGIIYVKANATTCFNRVIKRARIGETIPLEYLDNCNKYHNDWLSTEPSILTLNANEDRDPTKTDYDKWITIIKKYIHTKSFNKIMESYKQPDDYMKLCYQTHGV